MVESAWGQELQPRIGKQDVEILFGARQPGEIVLQEPGKDVFADQRVPARSPRALLMMPGPLPVCSRPPVGAGRIGWRGGAARRGTYGTIGLISESPPIDSGERLFAWHTYSNSSPPFVKPRVYPLVHGAV